MPFNLDNVARDVRWGQLEFDGEILRIAFRPSAINANTLMLLSNVEERPQGQVFQDMISILVNAISEWDLVSHGEKIEPDAQILGQIPWELLQSIMSLAVTTMTPEKKEPSGISEDGYRPTERLEVAQDGIQSSDPRGTWA